MHAMLVADNQAFVWTEVPDPVPGPDEILIEVHAAAVNRADLMQRAGNYPPPPGWPSWPGLEVAGIVLQAPESGRWRPGDSVCALLGGGGYAERVAVPAALALPAPAGLSLVEAAAIPEVFATAYLNLCLEGGLKAGERVLVQAGASGVGTAAIQLVKLCGGSVVTTVGSEEKVRFVRELGADVVVNRTTGDLGAVLDEHPIDLALDCVGGPELGPCLEKMQPGGRWIVIATLGGPRTELDVNLFFRRGLRLIGSTLRSRSTEVKSGVLAALERDLWGQFSARTVRPAIHATLPIAQADQAHAILERRGNLGKVVLTVR